jgi:hypothetical protein
MSGIERGYPQTPRFRSTANGLTSLMLYDAYCGVD